MDAFRPVGDGAVRTAIEPVEAALLTQLASQVAGILSSGGSSGPGDAASPTGSDWTTRATLARLLPDAYREDPDAAAEFRRFTAVELTDQKVRNAQRVIADVAEALVAEEPTGMLLGPESVAAWLRTLTDIRLVLATRLGIDHDGDLGRDDDEAFMLGDIYDWLGWMQDSLVGAMED